MKNQKTIVLIILLSVATIVAITYHYATGLLKLSEVELKKNLETREFIAKNIKLKESKYNKNVYEVERLKDITTMNQLYQEVVRKIIEKERKKHTLEDPLMIYNPYGTSKNSINVYFDTEEVSELEYTVSVDGFDDFTQTLKNEGENNLTQSHAYQIIGLIMGKKNHLKLTLRNKNQEIISEKEWTIDFTSLKSSVATKLKVKEGDSKEELSEGLYVMFGHDKAYNANNYIYDNNGVLRAELILEGYRSDRIVFLDNEIIYSNSGNSFIKVDREGRIVRKYSLGDYTMHHDYILDKENDNLLILANKNDADTIEDRVISLNLNTGKVKEVLDMQDFFQEMYEKAVKPKKNTYGGEELDWLHLNSLDIINGEDLILSSRELSTLIYMENIYRNPKVKYIITDPSTVENTNYENLNYEKKGNFVSQAGQHTITYQKEEDNYYLYMYNNNYQGARTRPSFNWKNYEGTGTYEKGDSSYYYKYLVNEEEKNYELVEKIALPYSSIVSSVEHVEDHIVTSSGMSHCFDEYDGTGTLIKEFRYTSKKYAYRIFKYTFHDIWFH